MEHTVASDYKYAKYDSKDTNYDVQLLCVSTYQNKEIWLQTV